MLPETPHGRNCGTRPWQGIWLRDLVALQNPRASRKSCEEYLRKCYIFKSLRIFWSQFCAHFTLNVKWIWHIHFTMKVRWNRNLHSTQKEIEGPSEAKLLPARRLKSLRILKSQAIKVPGDWNHRRLKSQRYRWVPLLSTIALIEVQR